jgi:hypothetical protein
MVHQEREKAECAAPDYPIRRSDRIAPVVQKMVMQIDANRTSLRTSSAQRRCLRKVLPFGQTAEMRRDDRSDRSLIGSRVGMSADIAKDRANVQAGSTTNTMESVPLFHIGQQMGATIVEQDNVHLFRTI